MWRGAYREVREELRLYGEGLIDKPEIVALNKCDALSEDERADQLVELGTAAGKTPLLVSGVSGEGVTELLRSAFRMVSGHKSELAGLAGATDEPVAWTPSA